MIAALIFLFATVSCSNQSAPEDYLHLPCLRSSFSGPSPGSATITICDSIYIDVSFSSLKGNWRICNDTLYYADEHLVQVTSFDSLGNKINHYFTSGRGPGEFISPPLAFFKLQNDFWCYIDKNSYFTLLDPALQKRKESNLLDQSVPRRDTKEFMKKLYNHPDPEIPAMYEITFQSSDFTEFSGCIVFPVTTEHIKYNGYFKNSRAKDFYRNSRTLMALGRDSLQIEHLFAKFPPVYHNKIIPNFKDCHITAGDSLLYVSYEADPHIYVYDNAFKLSGYFGEKEAAINDNYPQTFNAEDAETQYKSHRKAHGHYGHIKQAGDYLFRTYQAPGNKSGIQIYHRFHLIYSALLPYDTFDVTGYIKPYYYALVESDTENERYLFVKFSIHPSSTDL